MSVRDVSNRPVEGAVDINRLLGVLEHRAHWGRGCLWGGVDHGVERALLSSKGNRRAYGGTAGNHGTGPRLACKACRRIRRTGRFERSGPRNRRADHDCGERLRPEKHGVSFDAVHCRTRANRPLIRSSENGAPERIRTSDPQIRSLVLYPAELRARGRGNGRRAT